MPLRGRAAAQKGGKENEFQGFSGRLVLIFVSTLILMGLWKAAEGLLFPSLAPQVSLLITICISGILATVAAFYALRKFRRNEDTYARLVELSPSAVWVHRQGKIVMANRACATLFGASSCEDLLGKHVLDFVHPRDHNAVRMRIQNQVDDSNPIRHYETRYIRWDGREMDLDVVVCSILFGGEAASLVMFHDVLEQRLAEQKLRESEANLAAAQRIGHMGSWAMELERTGDLDENAVRWSDELFRIFGYEPGQVEPTRPFFLSRVHPDDRNKIKEEMARALAECRGYFHEYRIVRRGADERIIQGHSELILNQETKKPLRFVGTVRDVTEQKLAEQKLAQLALIVESSDDAITGVTADGTISSWNKGAERIYGYTAEEAIGRPVTILSSPNHPDEVAKFHERLMRGERIPAFETVRTRKGGQPISVSLTISPVKDPTGRIIGTSGTARDISAHKREEERSRRLAHLVDSANEMISTGDREGRVTFMNRAFLRAIGSTEEEVLGKYFRDLVLSPNNPPALREQIQADIMGKKRGWKGECLYRRKDGTDFPVYLSVAPLFDNAGRDIGNVAVLRDLTESKQVEERFYKAFHLNPEPITIATASEGRYVDVNESFLRITGYQRSEVIGRTSMELKFWEKVEDRNRLIELLEQNGSVRDLEITFLTKFGEQRVALDSAEVIELNSQKCIIAIFKDITESKALEKQIRQLQKMEAVGQLSGGVAHDFNNILSVILGYCDLLEEGLGRNNKLLRTVQEVKKAGLRAASLTRQLLAFSRQQVLEPKVLNLNAVVTDTEKMLRRLIGEHIEISCKLARDLGRVKADQGQIEQVIINLAVNARDAMPDGGKIVIETRNIELDEKYCVHHPPTIPGQYVELAVTDTGMGMDAQTQSHIFEPFFTTKELGKGTGLGLATVYGVVKQSGGYIWVYSEPGIGSTFKTYLPLVTETGGQPGPGRAKYAPAQGSETILLVEDEESLRSLTRTILEQSGYTVLEASGGKEAIEIARLHNGSIDLLLADVIMPGMNGYEVARRLRLAHPSLKVVYMSGYSGFGMRAPSESGDVFLTKPLTRDALLRKLHEVLHLQKDFVV